MDKIKLVSRLIQFFLCFTLISIIISLLVALLIEGGLLSWGERDGANMWVGLSIQGSWSQFAQLLDAAEYDSLLLLGPIQLLPYFLVNLVLIRLFALYQKGYIFTPANIKCFIYLGWILIAQFVITLLYPPILTTLLNILHPEIILKRIISINDTDIIILLLGIIISVIGWVMAEANKLQEEQELVI